MSLPASADLRLGKWEDVLADVTCDALICDPPYSPRVHNGQRTGSETRKSTIIYDPISPDWCNSFAAHWSTKTTQWSITFSDHAAANWWGSAWESAGWYVFAPVLWIRTNPTPRMAGDGPTSACDYITIARPRRRLESCRTGSRPGYYLTSNDPGSVLVAGGKQIAPMRAIVRDYTRPGDLVCDPCAGGGTTLLAALSEGRRAVGAEMDPKHFEIAQKRLARGFTPPLFSDPGPASQQLDLTGSDD